MWDHALLDGESLLPEIGPALVLAATALETMIESALEALARQPAVPSLLWNWINNRRDWEQEPSIEERFDVLLRILAGRSLKEESGLWQAFRNLRTARNKFVHEGVASIGGQEVTREQAAQLVAQAKLIIDWVEALLPPGMQRPRARGMNTLEAHIAI